MPLIVTKEDITSTLESRSLPAATVLFACSAVALLGAGLAGYAGWRAGGWWILAAVLAVLGALGLALVLLSAALNKLGPEAFADPADPPGPAYHEKLTFDARRVWFLPGNLLFGQPKALLVDVGDGRAVFVTHGWAITTEGLYDLATSNEIGRFGEIIWVPHAGSLQSVEFDWRDEPGAPLRQITLAARSWPDRPRTSVAVVELRALPQAVQDAIA